MRPGKRADQLQFAEDPVERHHHRDDRRHARRDDPEEQVALAAEIDARQAVGGHRSEDHRDHRRAAGGDQAVGHVLAEVEVYEQVLVVLKGRREVEEQGDARPVAHRRDLEGFEEVLEGRHEHHKDRQQRPHHVERDEDGGEPSEGPAQGRLVLNDIAGGHRLCPLRLQPVKDLHQDHAEDDGHDE